MGGILTELVTWRWVFLVNVPVAAAVIALAPRVLAEGRGESKHRPDLSGAATVSAGLPALVFGRRHVWRGLLPDAPPAADPASVADSDGFCAANALPGLVLVSIGMGLAFTNATVAATAGISDSEQGLASGLLVTSQQVGASIGLAALTAIAAAQTRASVGPPAVALVDGFQVVDCREDGRPRPVGAAGRSPVGR